MFAPALDDEHIVGNVVPGVVDADEKQQQRRAANAKQRLALWEGAANDDSASIAYAARGSTT